jgi:hypothetical protein
VRKQAKATARQGLSANDAPMAELGALTEPGERFRGKTVKAHSGARWGKRCTRKWRVASDGICRRSLCRESDGLADGNRREQVVGGVGCVQAVCGCKEEHTCNEIGDVRAQVCAPPGPAPISRDLLRAASSIDITPLRVTCNVEFNLVIPTEAICCR